MKVRFTYEAWTSRQFAFQQRQRCDTSRRQKAVNNFCFLYWEVLGLGITFLHVEMTTAKVFFLECGRIWVLSHSTTFGTRSFWSWWDTAMRSCVSAPKSSQVKLQPPQWVNWVSQEPFYEGEKRRQVLSCAIGTTYIKNLSALCSLLNHQLFVKLHRTSSLSMQ